MKRLAIITTHPIQYNAPMFRMLHQRGLVQVKVFYTWGLAGTESKYDPGFNKHIKWDIPLLEGYDFEFAKNISEQAGSHYFKGIVNPDLIDMLLAYNPDAILVYGWCFHSHLKVMRYFRGKVNILFRGDSTLLDKQAWWRRLTRYVFLQWVFTHIDTAIYVGAANRHYYLKFGLKDPQLIRAPHAVENTRFSFTNTLGDTARQKRIQLGISESDIVLLFAGKLEPKKAPELLLQAFLDLNAKHAHLVMVGSGVLEAKLKAMALGNNNVHFIEFQNQSQMPMIYHMADVFVLPSVGPGETWGLAVNEAMAAGKAVLVSDKCGCYIDLVEAGQNGYVFKSGDALSLSEKLNLMQEKAMLAEFGKRSEAIIQDYSFEHICKAIESTV